MDGNFKISCRRGQMLLVACDGMKLKTGTCVDRMVKPDWSNFPRYIERDLDNGLLSQQYCALHVYGHAVPRPQYSEWTVGSLSCAACSPMIMQFTGCHQPVQHFYWPENAIDWLREC